MKKAYALVIVLSLFISSFGIAGSDAWLKVAIDIEKALDGALKEYEKGKTEKAMEMVADAYFGIFEGEKANMEIAVRRFLSLKRMTELERGFSDLRKAMFNKASITDIKKQTASLADAVKNAARELDKKGVKLSSGF